MIYPTNSKGQICGRGNLTDRPFLLFFDLTRCLNPAVLALGCPTPQVCVEKCPEARMTLCSTLYYKGECEIQISLFPSIVQKRG